MAPSTTLVAPSATEIDEQITHADTSVFSGSSKWPGLTYEDGVSAALRWARGTESLPPTNDEDF